MGIFIEVHSWKMIFLFIFIEGVKWWDPLACWLPIAQSSKRTFLSQRWVTVQDGHATILKHVGEIAMKTSRCHCNIAIACLFSPPSRRKNAKQNLFPALLKRKSNFFYKTSVLLLCSASNRLSKNSFPCLAIQMPPAQSLGFSFMFFYFPTNFLTSLLMEDFSAVPRLRAGSGTKWPFAATRRGWIIGCVRSFSQYRLEVWSFSGKSSMVSRCCGLSGSVLKKS